MRDIAVSLRQTDDVYDLMIQTMSDSSGQVCRLDYCNYNFITVNSVSLSLSTQLLLVRREALRYVV